MDDGLPRVDTQEKKLSFSHHEVQHVDAAHPNCDGHKGDAALKVLRDGERVHMTEEQVSVAGHAAVGGWTDKSVCPSRQSEIVRRKIDRRILPILVWMYMLQKLDKSCLGYGANFGLRKEAVSAATCQPNAAF
jgi:hypothetical protein